MKYHLLIILFFVSTLLFGQGQNAIGTFSNEVAMSKLIVTFKADSTFDYVSEIHPTFNRWEDFAEKGKWTTSGDTIILNPQLDNKPFIQSEFQEYEIGIDTSIILSFNHIKRYFDNNGNLIKTDTIQLTRVDYALNKLKKKSLTRVAPHNTTRCAFAGYIPKEIITTNRTISVPKPSEKLVRIFIGCYELQGTKEFIINNPKSNYLVLNLYSNYYQDGQIRQKKFLLKDGNFLYTKQKSNGRFDKDIWQYGTVLRKEKGGG